MAAGAFAGIRQLTRTFFPPGSADIFAKELAEFCGLNWFDGNWVTPEGRDVTHICNASGVGGFGGTTWTLQGWVLDELSITGLKNEFPEEFTNRC